MLRILLGESSALGEAQAAPHCHAYWTPVAGNALNWEINLTLLSSLVGRRALLTKRLPAAATRQSPASSPLLQAAPSGTIRAYCVPSWHPPHAVT